MYIIDVHTHIFPRKIADRAVKSIGDFYGLPMSGTALSDDLDRACADVGIARNLVFSTATTPHQVASINSFIHEKCTQYPRFIGFGTLHPAMDNPDAEIERICDLGLHGIKLHPDFQEFDIDDGRMLPIYRRLAAYELPVLFHMGDARYTYSHPERLARVLDRVPDLRVIAAHFGGYSAWDISMRVLAGSSAYYDTSSTLAFVTPERAGEMIGVLGVDRIFFGTDYPMWNIREELDRFFALGLSEEDNRKILSENFINAFPHICPPLDE
ncbi:MAG: amidohydrolase family protein [Eubacteriales bacterium]|jgi:predicted TIM-barrel fold metal-dependent hydrolase